MKVLLISHSLAQCDTFLLWPRTVPCLFLFCCSHVLLNTVILYVLGFSYLLDYATELLNSVSTPSTKWRLAGLNLDPNIPSFLVLIEPDHAEQGRIQDDVKIPSTVPCRMLVVSSCFYSCSRVSHEVKTNSDFFWWPQLYFPGSISPSRIKMFYHGHEFSSWWLYFKEEKKERVNVFLPLPHAVSQVMWADF